MTTILLSGAGGFSGAYMKRFLEAQGATVHTFGAKALPKERSERHMVVDIGNADVMAALVRSIKPDAIFHLAGVVRSPDPMVFYRVNTEFSVALLTGIEKTGEQIPTLMVGTAAEVGQPRAEHLPIREDMPAKPLEHYGISKLAQTHAALAAHKRTGLPVVVARPSNIIGAGMPEHFVVQSFASQIASIMRGAAAPVLKTGNLASARDFIAIETVCQVYWDLLRSPEAYGEVVNVCSGIATPITEIVETLTKLSGREIRVETDPALYRAVDVPVHYGSVEKLLRILGTLPPRIPLEVTLERVLQAS